VHVGEGGGRKLHKKDWMKAAEDVSEQISEEITTSSREVAKD
jgi:hypothetical protein